MQHTCFTHGNKFTHFPIREFVDRNFGLRPVNRGAEKLIKPRRFVTTTPPTLGMGGRVVINARKKIPSTRERDLGIKQYR